MGELDLWAESESLKRENCLLRARIKVLEAQLEIAGLSEGNGDNLTLTEAFNALSFKGRIPSGMKLRAFNCLTRAGFKTVGEFKDKCIVDLLNVRNVGVDVCAITVIVLEHFGVSISFSESDYLPKLDLVGSGARGAINLQSLRKTQIKQILEKLPKFREKCMFFK